MPEKRTKFYERINGPMAEKEDWWYLIEDTKTGKKKVVHDWSHSSLRGSGDHGSKEMTVEEFLDSTDHEQAKDALQKILG